MHRFLSPAAAEAFNGCTPEQVRDDLAEMDAKVSASWVEPDGWPDWVVHLDAILGPNARWEIVFDNALRHGFRFLADQAATNDLASWHVRDGAGKVWRLRARGGGIEGREYRLVPVEEGE